MNLKQNALSEYKGPMNQLIVGRKVHGKWAIKNWPKKWERVQTWMFRTPKLDRILLDLRGLFL